MNEPTFPPAHRRAFATNTTAMSGLCLFALIALACAGSGLGADPNAINLDAVLQPPSRLHWLGTDHIGRDVLARTLAAGRISLSVGLASVSLAMALGTLLGAFAGYFGGWIDSLVMRIVDTVMSFPPVIVLMTLAAVFGSGTGKTVLVLALLSWPLVCRLVRARMMLIREMEYVAAARTLGAGHAYLIFRHCLPHTADVLAVFFSLGFVSAIMAEAGLSFLGLGVQLPHASWGSLIGVAREASVLKQYPWIWLPSGVCIVLTALAANFVADGLRQAFHPTTGHGMTCRY